MIRQDGVGRADDGIGIDTGIDDQDRVHAFFAAAGCQAHHR